MRHFLPGTLAEIDELSGGDCVLMFQSEGLRLGMVVVDRDGRRSVLDFEAEDETDRGAMQVYHTHSLDHSVVLHVPSARIVPSVDPQHLSQGFDGGGGPTRAIYLTKDGLIAQARYTRHTYRIKLEDGSLYQGDLAGGIHSTTWRIECDDGTGRFRTLREFTTTTPESH